MKYIFITDSFQKKLKKFKRHFTEKDVVEDIKEFINVGLRKNETYLKSEVILEVPLKIAKLRLQIFQVHARYLLGVVTGKEEYLPIFIDLKKGKHGENLSFEARKQTREAIRFALEQVVEVSCPQTRIIGVRESIAILKKTPGFRSGTNWNWREHT